MDFESDDDDKLFVLSLDNIVDLINLEILERFLDTGVVVLVVALALGLIVFPISIVVSVDFWMLFTFLKVEGVEMEEVIDEFIVL